MAGVRFERAALEQRFEFCAGSIIKALLKQTVGSLNDRLTLFGRLPVVCIVLQLDS